MDLLLKLDFLDQISGEWYLKQRAPAPFTFYCAIHFSLNTRPCFFIFIHKYILQVAFKHIKKLVCACMDICQCVCVCVCVCVSVM